MNKNDFPTVVGQNIRAKQEDNLLVLVIDLEETIGPSSSGKMMGIASTGGFTPLFAQSSRGKTIKLNLYLGEK